jgi:hypothetical protein
MPAKPTIRPITFRGTAEYLAHLERLRVAAGAPTTSALIETALARYSRDLKLGKPPRRADPPGGDRRSPKAREVT